MGFESFLHVYIISNVSSGYLKFTSGIVHYSDVWRHTISFGSGFDVFIHQHRNQLSNENPNIIFQTKSIDVYYLICARCIMCLN